MDNGDPRFPYPRYLKVPFVFVPDGNPPPLEWMRDNPNYVTVRGVFIPHPPSESKMALEPRPDPAGQLELLHDAGTYEVVIDYAGNFIARPVAPLTPQPEPRTEPPSAAKADRLFEARCQAAWEAAQSPEVHARTDQRIAAVVPQASAAGPTSRRRQPEPPAPGAWPQGISKAEADRLFAAASQAARQVAKRIKSYARTGIKVVEEAIIAQARADGILAAAAVPIPMPVVKMIALAALAAVGVVEEIEGVERILRAAGEQPSVPARSGGRAFPGFEPPPPSPPLPGLVPPPLPQTKPGAGGFTPSPPSVPVHPGRQVEANKPLIVESRKGGISSGATSELASVLAPGGQVVGTVHPGAGQDIKTMTPNEFDILKAKLLQNAQPISDPSSYKGYKGTVYVLPDGEVFGLRTSALNGETIDVFASKTNLIPKGFKVHQK
jgi:hypothetical protein